MIYFLSPNIDMRHFTGKFTFAHVAAFPRLCSGPHLRHRHITSAAAARKHMHLMTQPTGITTFVLMHQPPTLLPGFTMLLSHITTSWEHCLL